MLKDRYIFKMSMIEAVDLNSTLGEFFERYSQNKSTHLLLVMTVLMTLKTKLHAKMHMPQEQVKIIFKQHEAVAFHLAYSNKLLRGSVVTAHINTEIHKTLC